MLVLFYILEMKYNGNGNTNKQRILDPEGNNDLYEEIRYLNKVKKKKRRKILNGTGSRFMIQSNNERNILKVRELLFTIFITR